MFVDFHTHRAPPPEVTALVSVTEPPDAGVSGYFSLELHPWRAGSALPERFRSDAANPAICAIGEIGLDKLRGGAFQQARFEDALAVADDLGKPAVLHCVRAFGEIERLRKRHTHIPAWLLHGVDLAPARLRERFHAGYFVSFGMRQLRRPDFDAAAFDWRRCGLETDDAPESIAGLYRELAGRTGIGIARFEKQFEENFAELFG